MTALVRSAAQINDDLVAIDAADLKKNASAASAPAATDDSAAGYVVGSRWFNTATGILYYCSDATAGAAVWKEIIDADSVQSLDGKTLGGTTPKPATVTSLNGGSLAGLRNAIINGAFAINQRAVSGTVTLAAGAYGHDRWKAGAAGCTYTFSIADGVTTLTISAGSLQQVIEGANLRTGSYAVSWSGTAQGKVAGGAYAASGFTAAATGGTNLTLEFGTGTLSEVMCEPGATVTPFELRPYGAELDLCQRYYETGSAFFQFSYAASCGATIPYRQKKRASPTVSFFGVSYSNTSTLANQTGFINDKDALAFNVNVNGSSGYLVFDYSADSEL